MVRKQTKPKLPYVKTPKGAAQIAKKIVKHVAGVRRAHIKLGFSSHAFDTSRPDKMVIEFIPEDGHDIKEVRERVLEFMKPKFNSKDTDWIVQTDPLMQWREDDGTLLTWKDPTEKPKKKRKPRKKREPSPVELREQEFVQRVKAKVKAQWDSVERGIAP